jgi:hypothetical protein
MIGTRPVYTAPAHHLPTGRLPGTHSLEVRTTKSYARVRSAKKISMVPSILRKATPTRVTRGYSGLAWRQALVDDADQSVLLSQIQVECVYLRQYKHGRGGTDSQHLSKYHKAQTAPLVHGAHYCRHVIRYCT